METRNFSAQQRRAMNIVWTGAGDYGFEPPFLGTYATGFPRLNSPPDCSSNAKHCFLPFLVFC